MKINTKIRYGIRMVVAIARAKGFTNTTELGNQLMISPKYLRKLAGPLEKAGIIASSQGIYGGYMLGKPPEMINLKMIWEAFQEKFTIVNCLDSKACPLNDDCLTRSVWKKFDDLIQHQFMTITIHDILSGK